MNTGNLNYFFYKIYYVNKLILHQMRIEIVPILELSF